MIGAVVVAGIAAHIGTRVTPRKTQTKYRWYSTKRKKKTSAQAAAAAAAAEDSRRRVRDDSESGTTRTGGEIVHTRERVVAPPPDIVVRLSEREGNGHASPPQQHYPARAAASLPPNHGDDTPFVNVVDVRRAASAGGAESGVFIRHGSSNGQGNHDPYSNHIYSEIVTVPPTAAGAPPAVEETSFNASPSSSGAPVPSAPPASSLASAAAAAAGEPPVKQRLTLSDGDDLHEVSETDLLHLANTSRLLEATETDTPAAAALDEEEEPQEDEPLMRGRGLSGADLTGALALVSEDDYLDMSASRDSSASLPAPLNNLRSSQGSLLSPRTSVAGASPMPETPRQTLTHDDLV